MAILNARIRTLPWFHASRPTLPSLGAMLRAATTRRYLAEMDDRAGNDGAGEWVRGGRRRECGGAGERRCEVAA